MRLFLARVLTIVLIVLTGAGLVEAVLSTGPFWVPIFWEGAVVGSTLLFFSLDNRSL